MIAPTLINRCVEPIPKAQPCGEQAGCRIAELATALREHGLTLPNYASIREQAIGGFIQARPCCHCTDRNMDLPLLRVHTLHLPEAH